MTSTNQQKQPLTSRVKAHALRLLPHQDPLKTLTAYVKQHQLQAVSIASAVGSLEYVKIRLANSTSFKEMKGYFEIVSMSGTFSKDGRPHVHLAVSDKDGVTLGGHMCEGCLIYTTLEIVLLEMEDLVFSRVLDNTYGWDELVVEKKK